MSHEFHNNLGPRKIELNILFQPRTLRVLVNKDVDPTELSDFLLKTYKGMEKTLGDVLSEMNKLGGSKLHGRPRSSRQINDIRAHWRTRINQLEVGLSIFRGEREGLFQVHLDSEGEMVALQVLPADTTI